MIFQMLFKRWNDHDQGEAKIATDLEDKMVSVVEDLNINEEFGNDGKSTSVCSQKRKSMFTSNIPSSREMG